MRKRLQIRRLMLAPMFALVACLAIPTQANAASILFAHVANYGPYVTDGNQIAGFLSSAGHTVTIRNLDAAIYADYGSFDQVWVYDLYAGPDQSVNQLANYANIAAWFNGLALADQNLIADGRIISSGPNWVAGGEPAWIQNYATQLDGIGGGLVLGTDHATDFTRGINNINALIGIGDFHGFYLQQPLEAFVDPNSVFWLPTLASCSFSPANKCVNDNSSTSFVPTGTQANGRFLTPVAYHGSVTEAFELAAVSSTIGSETFPDPGVVPEPATLLLLGGGLAGAAVKRVRGRK